ncbi:hypothetical protein IT774_04255 [Salinimonas marina]|uniref:Uncharacterized protein n=1 Tax=Salinimonas marina TaxID=2785918 RepID=A0A7S9HDL9_9ALTE|nr:hypothetical protein [Salinimonas marina]QPG06411.1 hypothetical protein IT774_04255 [Salinimonas marina]
MSDTANKSSEQHQNSKVCFVLFSRAIDKNAKNLARQFDGNGDFCVLTYDDTGEANDEIDDGIRHVVYNRRSLNTVFTGCAPKFAMENWAIMPGNLDLAHLLFVNQNQDYDYFWFCEDDVRYTGDMSSLIRKFEHHNDALLATNYRGYGPEWWPQNSYVSPVEASMSDKSVFLPFFRISKKAAHILIKAYANGWSGHHEISWPSVLRYNKLAITDLNSITKCYTSSPEVMGMGPGTFIYMPPKLFAGFEKNMLYHPVKPFQEYKKRKWFRMKKNIKKAIGRN